jgi:hypothetical protein
MIGNDYSKLRIQDRRMPSMNRDDERDDEIEYHKFAPGEEPTVYTADICAEVGHEHCKGIDRTIEGYAGEPVFCNCLCHRVINGELN